MLRKLVVLLLVCAPNLVLCETANSAGSQPGLALIQNDEKFQTTLDVIRDGLIAILPDNAEAIRAQFSGLENLRSADENKRMTMLQTFFDEQMNLFLPKMGLPTGALTAYRGLLDESEKNLLEKFRDIKLHEHSFILVYPANHLSAYKEKEGTGYKPTWGELISVLREMLMELTGGMKMVDMPTTLEIFKTITQAYAEYAEGVFSRNEVTGDFLVLPLIVVQKLHETTPRKTFGTKQTTVSGGGNYKVLEELQSQGVTIDEVMNLLVKRIVRYYEKLDKVVFCKLRNRVTQLLGSSSVAAIAFNFADAHACSNMEATPGWKLKRRW